MFQQPDTDAQAHEIADAIGRMIDDMDVVADTITHPQCGFISTSEEPAYIKKPEKETVLLAATRLPNTPHTLMHLSAELRSSAVQPTERLISPPINSS